MKPFALTLCLLFAGAPVTRVEEAVRDLDIGDAAPDFALPGIDGKTHRLSDYKDGKVLIIFFMSDQVSRGHRWHVLLLEIPCLSG
jgi:hypothetical protein